MTRAGRLCAQKTTCTAAALVGRPPAEAFRHPAGERIQQRRGIVVALHEGELDRCPVQLLPGADLLEVALRVHRAVMRRQHDADGPRDALLRHGPDHLLDPRRPVPHAEVAAIDRGIQPRGKGRELALAVRAQRGASADQPVVIGDFLHDGARSRPARS